MSNKTNCIYPDCLHCSLPDCSIENPVKYLNYWKNPEGHREATRRYREKKRIEQGKKTMKEIQEERQNKIYSFMVDYTKENLYPPSTVEIQKFFGFGSNPDVSRDLHRLEDRGLIKIGKGNRAYSLVGYKIVKMEEKNGSDIAGTGNND